MQKAVQKRKLTKNFLREKVKKKTLFKLKAAYLDETELL